jgi:uncharacterized membrane protein
MSSLMAAAMFFVGIHLFISGTPLRDRLVARIGARAYQGLFSLISAAGLAWMIVAYLRVRTPEVTVLIEHRWIATVLNFLAFTFVVFGVVGRSPTMVGGEGVLHDEDPARAAHRITRHPMLWGIALWAATHMVFNAQAASLWFFGAFLVLALFGTRSIDAKRARALGDLWQGYAARTSNIPFAAILQGRNRLSLAELTDYRLLIGVLVSTALLMLHGKFFGLPAL